MQIVESLKDIVLKDTDSLKPSSLKLMEAPLKQRLKAPNMYPESWNQNGAVGQFCFNGRKETYNPNTGLVDLEQHFVNKTDGPCHGAFFRGSVHGVTDSIISFHMNNFWPQKDKKLLWWIIKDLFADMNDNVAVVIDHSVVRNFPAAIVLLDIEKQDMDYFGNFLISSRLVSHWNCSAVWTRLVSWGVLPELALLIALQTYWIDPDNRYSNVSGKNYAGELLYRHVVFGDIPFHPDVSLQRLVERDYVKKSLDYPRSKGRLLKDGVKGGRSNYIWSKGNLKPFEQQGLITPLLPYIQKNDHEGASDILDLIIKFYTDRG